MTNKIVLATDGSPSAEDATREALELAWAFGQPLIAVSVEHVTLPSYGYYGYSEIHAELHETERAHVLGVLAETARLAEEAGVECETVACNGDVVDEVCRVAREQDARMIVVGAHGWGPIHRMVFGSVSTGVMHGAPCPVLIVPGTTADTRARVHADVAAV
ncbi:MAG TPA: universal stress protein [Gaiellaceae bacterium]|jgi:nucleotide-binding universal stress UspA family protein